MNWKERIKLRGSEPEKELKRRPIQALCKVEFFGNNFVKERRTNERTWETKHRETENKRAETTAIGDTNKAQFENKLASEIKMSSLSKECKSHKVRCLACRSLILVTHSHVAFQHRNFLHGTEVNFHVPHLTFVLRT